LFLQFLMVFTFIGYMLAIHFPIVWQETDDIAMKRIASGYFTGSPDEHLIFINVALGWAFKVLYHAKPATQWYSWFFVFGLALVNSVFTFLIFRKQARHIGLSIIGLLAIGFLYLLKFNIEYQFTILSSLLAGSGYLLLHFYFRDNQDSKIWIVLASVLVFLSFLLRKESFLLLSIFMVPIFVYYIKSQWKSYLLIGGPLLTLMFACYIWNEKAYYSADWRDFMQYNKVRPMIPDASTKDFSSLKNEIHAAGWEMLDLKFRQIYMDECSPKFSVDKISNINKIIQTQASDSWLSHGLIAYWKNILYVFAFLVILLIFLRSTESILLLIAYIVAIISIYLVAIYIRIPDRVIDPIFFISTFLGILLLIEKVDFISRKIPLFIYTTLGIVFLYAIFEKISAFYIPVLSQLEIDKNHRVEFVKALKNDSLVGVVQVAPNARKVFNENLVFEHDLTPKYLRVMPSGWLNRTPIHIKFSEQFNVLEFCKLNVSYFNAHVYQVDFRNNFVLKEYIDKNYSSYKIDTVFVTTTGDYCAYRLVKK